MQFSNDFLWGAASASYQIEGAYLEDGKGENIWDAYCQESGHVAHGENGNVACDHAGSGILGPPGHMGDRAVSGCE